MVIAVCNRKPTNSTSGTVPDGVIPADRRTVWNPGIPGGVPNRTAVCKTLSPSGGADDSVAIQAAINACPANQVVLLDPGTYSVANAIRLKSNVVLRGSGGPGAGSSQTQLIGTPTLYGPVINIGPDLFPHATGTSVDCTADAVKGATSVAVSSLAGFKVGDLVLVDMLTDPANDQPTWIRTAPPGATSLAYPYSEYNPTRSPKGNESRGWFSRLNRPVAQVMEIASIDGTNKTLTLTSPFHITYDKAHGAQVTAFQYGNNQSTPIANAGIEDLYVAGPPIAGPTQFNNVVFNLAKYSWARNIESDRSNGYSVGLDQSFRSVLRDSYIHSTINPNPGGGGYGIEFSSGSADNLVENNISWNFNKVMVMRASGGGNVIAYNYMDDGWISQSPTWMETGLNASHMSCPHHELFEGNLAFNIGSDSTWGNAIFVSWFRNLATGRRSGWSPLDSYTFQGASYSDGANRYAVTVEAGHVFYTFVGNVLGYQGMAAAPAKDFVYEGSAPWPSDPVPMWRIGWISSNESKDTTDQNVVNTTIRDGNYDYVTKSVHWDRAPQNLPSSLYLTSKPGFFGDLNWPWVDATNASAPYQAQPYTFNGKTSQGFALPAYIRYLRLTGVSPGGGP
jgi:pectate lyase-like protein